jgi:hypothetical protein
MDVLVVVVDRDPVVASSPQANDNPTLLVNPTPRTVRIRNADRDMIDV